jgi:hypothetical protein
MPTRRQALLGGAAVSAGLLTSVYGISRRYDGSESVDVKPTDVEGRLVDVRDYGAEGDGEADDSAAIEDAIEAAGPGDVVLLPETDDSYLLSYDGLEDGESAIILDSESSTDNVTLLGETAAEGAQTLQVDAGSYDPDGLNPVINVRSNSAVNGLRFENLTIDGARPENDEAAENGGEASVVGFHLTRSSPYGQNDIEFRNCLVRNCSAHAFRLEELGVSCYNVTARGCGRHGFGITPKMTDKTAKPGFFGRSIKVVDCDGTGIDHRGGTAKFVDVYTENNRSGNKWKHTAEGLTVINHHSVNDHNEGWRSNHSADEGEQTPAAQEISFENVYVENADSGGIRVSGTDTPIKLNCKNVEVRNTLIESSGAGVRVFRDVELQSPINHLVVTGTRHGVGLGIYKAVVDIDRYDHFNNDEGGLNINTGEALIGQNRNIDPGQNVFQTPMRDDVGAFTVPE